MFDAPLSPGTVLLGNTAVVDCQVRSNPPATITWSYQLGTVTRTLATGGRVTISPGNRITIINVQEGDAGYYVCTARNVFGSNMTSGRLSIGSKFVAFRIAIAFWALQEPH